MNVRLLLSNDWPLRGRSYRKNIMSASQIDSPSHSEIAARAEKIYRESGCIPGRDLENWVRAENELKQRLENNGAAAKTKTPANGKSGARTQREKHRA